MNEYIDGGRLIPIVNVAGLDNMEPAEPSPEVAPMQECDHSYEDGVIEGRMVRHCRKCGDSYGPFDIPAVAPTQTGVCAHCGKPGGDGVCGHPVHATGEDYVKCGRLFKPVPAVAPRETQPEPTWEEALSEWWRTGVHNPKSLAVEDSFKAGWDARARLEGGR